MKILVPLLLLLLATPAPADAQRGEQMSALDARRAGKLMPLREIERRVIPTMPGAQYLGFDFDGGAALYTLKFLRDGSVIWVEVDGRTGQILGRSGR